MADNAQENITRFWSTVAPGYDAHAGNVAAKGSAEYSAWVSAVARLLPPVPAGILDIACGTGFVSIIAAGLGHGVTGIDISEQMLAEARAAAAAQHLNVRFEIGDAVAPSFPPASFDAITNRHFLWTLREPETAFRNWHTLLRPGGRVISIDSFWWGDQPADEAPPAPDDIFGQHYTKDTRAALPVMATTSPDPVAQMFRRAGFAKVEVTELADVHALAESPPSDKPWHVITAYRP